MKKTYTIYQKATDQIEREKKYVLNGKKICPYYVALSSGRGCNSWDMTLNDIMEFVLNTNSIAILQYVNFEKQQINSFLDLKKVMALKPKEGNKKQQEFFNLCLQKLDSKCFLSLAQSTCQILNLKSSKKITFEETLDKLSLVEEKLNFDDFTSYVRNSAAQRKTSTGAVLVDLIAYTQKKQALTETRRLR